MKSFLLASLVLLIGLGNGLAQAPDFRTVKVNDAEFHYLEKGNGPTVVMLHGGIGDLRSWNAQVDELSKNFRVVSYSRRFHYPNRNQPPKKPYSVYTEAEDLLAFLRALEIKKAHLVGTSIGAFVALVFAIEHPRMVNSLVLGEPPVHQLVRSEPEGEKIYQDFLNSLRPVRDAFEKGDDRDALRLFGRSLGRDLDRLPPAVIEQQMQNAAGVRANILAVDPFPAISESTLTKLKIPTLLVTGGQTVLIHRRVDEKLARLLPNARQRKIEGSGHTPNRENPEEYNKAILEFLQSVSHKSVKNK